MFPGEQKIQFLSSQEYESLEKGEGWDENGRFQISKITELPEIFGVYIVPENYKNTIPVKSEIASLLP